MAPGQADAVAELLGAELAPEFRILRPLGEGAAARVYLAGETGLERLVAVKVLRPELAGDERIARRFLREARSAARIVHPNVVTVYRVGTLSDGLPYIVMEYVAGRTLADRLAAGGPPPPEETLRILAQLASALAAAHEHRVIHRDIRPGNILLEEESGRAVLSDFGIAGIVDTGSEIVTHLTRAGEILGDPRYASPEQLLGEPVTEAADLYSLGVLGYELLTGRPPFPGATVQESVAAQLRGETPTLVPLHTGVPPAAAQVLERCLARRPEERPLAAAVGPALDPVGGRSSGASMAFRPEHPPAFPILSEFLAELRRRRVYRTAAAYLAGMFVLLEGTSLVLPALSAPEWIYRALVLLLLCAFPGVLALSWAFDFTREGIRRTEALDTAAGHRGARLVLGALGLVAGVVVAGLLAWWLQ